jgi:hypothetical protein
MRIPGPEQVDHHDAGTGEALSSILKLSRTKPHPLVSANDWADGSFRRRCGACYSALSCWGDDRGLGGLRSSARRRVVMRRSRAHPLAPRAVGTS